MDSTATVEIIDPPKGSEFGSYTCSRCEFEELENPVFLSDGGVYGAGCAAILLGIRPDVVVRERDRRMATARQTVTADAERLVRYAAALADFQAKGNAIVREGPAADFNALRMERGARDAALIRPVAFAEWLERRIVELGG